MTKYIHGQILTVTLAILQGNGENCKVCTRKGITTRATDSIVVIEDESTIFVPVCHKDKMTYIDLGMNYINKFI